MSYAADSYHYKKKGGGASAGQIQQWWGHGYCSNLCAPLESQVWKTQDGPFPIIMRAALVVRAAYYQFDPSLLTQEVWKGEDNAIVLLPM
jgi:hypothetical protein